jgi:hypothetical protein
MTKPIAAIPPRLFGLPQACILFVTEPAPAGDDTDDMLAELSARLLDAVGAALDFGRREGGELIHRAVSVDLAAAGHVGNSSLDTRDAPIDPSERGPLGILWPGGPPKWWRPAV